ncbi:MAG: S-layer homology domain-containing protein [Anaerolineales bacterium]|uniref:S-layer homology domain-containing protein n=1 Tax=Candidatus Villigracilis proximus TaxID=3140683 RepID=UPI0031348397|nr:S-layer homology domain-containing protein [Anaerolineales bacterium]
MYAGGNFSSANGVVGANVIAVWNSGTQIWSAMGNNPFGSYVTSIAVDGANVYAGGIFTNAASIPTADYVAKWNGSSWSALGSNGAGNGALNSTVSALAVIQNDLWVGGDFLDVNNNGTRLKAADKLAVFGLDIPPTVSSVTRASATPTGAVSVDFTVTFSESVTGVDETDFSLTTTGVTSAAVSGVSGTGSSYTVSVNTGVGSGTIRLNVLDDDSIKDAALNPLAAGFTTGESYIVSKSPVFEDVPFDYWANSYIERLAKAGITGGCSAVPLNYCPDSTVTRAQMAVFLLKSMHGSSFSPPAVGASTGFGDVATTHWAAAWIKQLAAEGITSGCGAGIYCPDSTVTRAQMAVFLLKAKNGSSYVPPAVGISTGFNDVAVNYWAAPFIKQLVTDGITSGCGNSNYCPDSDVTRAQMAVFLVKTFNLP